MRKDKMKAAKTKTGNYCAYQERTHQEVREKLYTLGLYSDEVEAVLTELITENFVNEERFAKTFAGGKFRMKRWGKRKIEHELKQRKISPYCIDKALQQITEEEYNNVISVLIKKKQDELSSRGLEKFVVKSKIAKYLIGRGFEPELVWSVLNDC